MIKHSPVLGMNVAVNVTIDGRNAGAFTKGHIFERFIAPGRHVIGVFPNGHAESASRITVNLRAGQTYSYVASYRVRQLVLNRVARIP